MGEPRMTVCRCCGQAMTSSLTPAGNGNWQSPAALTGGERASRRYSEQLKLLIASVESMARRAGTANVLGAGAPGANVSSLELLTAVVASAEGAAFVERLGGDSAGLVNNLGILCRARVEALGETVRGAMADESHDSDDVATLLDAAARLAAGEAADMVEVRHLLAVFAAPDCRVPGAALLRASVTGSQREARVARATQADVVSRERRDDLRRQDNLEFVDRDAQRGTASPELRDMAPMLASIERTLGTLGREVVRISGRLGQLERAAEDAVRAARMERTKSVPSEPLERGGYRGEAPQVRDEREGSGQRARFTQVRRSVGSGPITAQGRTRQQVTTAVRTGTGSSARNVASSSSSTVTRSSFDQPSAPSATSSSSSSSRTSTSRYSSSGTSPSGAQSLRRKRRRLARAGRRTSSRGLRRKYWQRLSDRRAARESSRGRNWRNRPQTALRSDQRPPRLTRTQAAAGFAEPTAVGAVRRSEAGASDREQDKEKRFYLAADDDIVDAPGIGPRTAERFREIGLLTVRDLLRADAIEASRRIATRWIRPETVASWQSQARLVCTVPWLRGTHAQLLVGAGYATLSAIASAEPGAVAASILRYAQTREGRSILRDGVPPEVERIEGWLENASQAEANRVA